MSRAQSGGEYALDLGPELGLHLLQARLLQQFRDAFGRIEEAGSIDEGRHPLPGLDRPPAIFVRMADDGQMDTERDVGTLPQQAHRVGGPWTGSHQARGGDHPLLEGAEYPVVDRVTHPEIVGVDDQESIVSRIAE